MQEQPLGPSCLNAAMHRWDERTDLLAHSVIGYAIERLKMPKDPTWGARPADQLAAALEGAIRPEGIGGHEALALFRFAIRRYSAVGG